MAKLCSSYGSSPSLSFFSEELYIGDLGILNNDLNLSNTDLGLINPDPDELFEDVNLFNVWPTSSICSDIQKMKSDSPTVCGGLLENCMSADIKPEIRNIDCMWSASTSLLSTSASSTLSDGVSSSTAVPLSAITGSNTQNISNNEQRTTTTTTSTPPTIVVANNLNNANKNAQTFNTLNIKQEIKEEPFDDDYEQQLQQHSIPNNNNKTIITTAPTTKIITTNKQQQQQQKRTILPNMQQIPPGASLLRTSHQQQQRNKQQQQKQKQQQQTTIQIPKMYAGEFVRERDQLLTITANNNNNNNITKITDKRSSYLRPDTPHSLDDDMKNAAAAAAAAANRNNNGSGGEVFKHNIDLHACVMGSNNISLTSDPTNFIHHVSQQLQDTTKTQIDLRFVSAACSLADVTEVLENLTTTTTTNNNNNINNINGGIGGGVGDIGDGATNSSGIDCDSDSAEDEWPGAETTRCSLDSMLNINTATSPVPSQDSLLSSSSNKYHQEQPPYLMHSDHSYTRCKDGIDDLGPNLETPSDSGKFLFIYYKTSLSRVFSLFHNITYTYTLNFKKL